MKPISPSLFFLLLLGIFITTNATAEVYKQTNPDGSVTFSDKPSKINDEAIKLPPSSTYKPPPPQPIARPKPKKAVVNYESVSISSPANDTAIRDNAGNLTIKIDLKPGLKPGHSYALLMNGKNVGEGQTAEIQLKNLDRGSHTFIAQVVDENKKMLVQSKPVVVHLKRFFVKP